MAQINLLPWRDTLREERKREFMTVLVGVIIIAGGLLFLVDRHYRGEINSQNQRNQFLLTEIATLDQQVQEINQLLQQKEEIRERMNVIQDLQGSRPVIVRIFDELVRTLPQGVYYQNLTRTGDAIAIQGVAESYARLTELMRRLEDSEWFQQTSLRVISAAEGQDIRQNAANAFTLSMMLESARRDEDEE
ncbi:MAG: PilN domain-containing protein [Pseudohongiellaceae bacterium]